MPTYRDAPLEGVDPLEADPDPFGRNAPAAFGHLGLVNVAIWADPERQLAAALVSSGKPGRDPEARRYTALMDRIAAEVPQVPRG